MYHSCSGGVEDYIECELIGGVSPRHLYTFSILFFLLLAVPLHTSIYAMFCCYCSLHPNYRSASFLRGLGNIAQENI